MQNRLVRAYDPRVADRLVVRCTLKLKDRTFALADPCM
jgi:hypothetical protein